MEGHLNQAYLDVALECYRRVRVLREGTEDAEVAEHAISLALERRDSELDAPLLLHDVLRNSRHSIRRGRARLRSAVAEAGQLALRGVASGGTPGFEQRDSPERICAMRDDLRALRDTAASCGPHGRRVLVGLLAGETSAETAVAAGISRATVERTVRRLRDAANDTGLRAAA